MSKEIKNKIAFLKDAILNDKLVVFAGSGVSADSGIPLWNELLEGIKAKLNFDANSETDALKISQLLFNEKGEKEYYEIIENLLFKDCTNRYNPLHELIFKLNPQHIVTTNYDNFFEQIIEEQGLPFSLVVKDEDLPYAKHKNLVIKYHGDFENHNVVLKETDYLEFSKVNTLKEIFVKSLFSNKVVLFIGYSFSDINLKLLCHDVQYILKKHHQRAFLLDLGNSISESEKTYYKNHGINIINYGQAKNEITDLDNFYTYEQLKLSDFSERAFKVLNYLKEFDLNKYNNNIGVNLTDDQVIDEVYNAFKKFYYFRVLPKDFLSNLYPINKNAKSSWLIDDNIFICFNQEFYNVILKFEGEDDTFFNKNQKEKILYCLSRLIYSGVFFIALPKQKPDSVGYYGFEKESLINLESRIKIEIDKECISYNLNNYKYSNVFIKIEKYTITSTTDLFDDLNFANTLYKLKQNFKSFYAFRQIYYKANKLKKFEVSFIAIYNLYWLGKNSSFIFDNYVNQDDQISIKNIVDNIDLDKELYKVKYLVDEKVYELLREIRSGIYMQNLCDEIDENYQKIPETKKLIENGGGSINNDIQNLYKSILNLENYRDLNFINGNGYSRINKAIQKSINAFIVAYSMKFIENELEESFFSTPHMSNYNHYLIKEIIEYAETDKLSKFIEENKLKNIEISEDSIQEIFSNISNFLDSAITSSGIKNHKSANQVFVSRLNSDTSFRIFILNQFDNICLVLTYFKLPSDILNELFQKLNYFIKFVKFKVHFDYRYLNKLLVNKYLEIESSSILNTLEIFYSNNRFDENYNRILNVLKAKDENFTTNLFDINQYEINNSKGTYYLVYNCLETDHKILFIEKLSNFLKTEEAELHMFFNAFYYGIINEPQIRDNYLNTIKEKLLNYKSDNDKYNNQADYDVINFFLLIYKNKIELKGFENIEIKGNYFNFLFDPYNFPVEQFNPEWLKIANYDAFFEKFKCISYIWKSLENHLLTNEDFELMKLYFKYKNSH